MIYKCKAVKDKCKSCLVKIFQDFITINKGEQVSVSFGMAPNNTNKRDLEIRIKTDFDGEKSSLHENNAYKMR